MAESYITRAPVLIEFMLACYAKAYPAEEIGPACWNSPVGKEMRKWLLDNDLIDKDDRATERGEAWVKFIIDTPLPVAEWTLPERRAA